MRTVSIWAAACAVLLAQGAAFAKTFSVTIEGFEYKPAKITVSKGDEVTFINKDSAPHTVTPEKGAKFEESVKLQKNDKATIKFEQKGVQNYYCAIHPSMKGSVVVK